MSYLLIGNISALICEECIEPLANARIRIYLPATPYGAEELARGIFKDLRLLSERDVQAKDERLLAESRLDERGNFSIGWEDLHLFTEPLEMDICLNNVPGMDQGRQEWLQYHLSTFVPHWKRSREKYVAAFAYVVPSEKWSAIRREFNAWALAGTVRHFETHEVLRGVRVEAYNALSKKPLAFAVTGENGRYRMYFSRPGGKSGPDVYFKVYGNHGLIWSEDPENALQPERQQIAHCAKINLAVVPAAGEKKAARLTGWISDFISSKSTKSHYKDRYVMY
ncbi:MAG: hypothetical protein ACTHLD_20730 [Chitinophaga sp.]|jgi:hypothetical protein